MFILPFSSLDACVVVLEVARVVALLWRIRRRNEFRNHAYKHSNYKTTITTGKSNKSTIKKI